MSAGTNRKSTMRNTIIPYNPKLKVLARQLRKQGVLSEVLLWKAIKGKAVRGYEFHRQVPLDEFIVDFYCHELRLAIEIDGSSHDHRMKDDEARQKRLESLGVRFVRFRDKQVKQNIGEVLACLHEFIIELEQGTSP